MFKQLDQKVGKIKEHSSTFRREVKHQTLTYILAAFGLVASLAWNDAIHALIDYLFPLGKNSLWPKFIYAVTVTLIAVFLSVYLVAVFKGEKD